MLVAVVVGPHRTESVKIWPVAHRRISTVTLSKERAEQLIRVISDLDILDISIKMKEYQGSQEKSGNSYRLSECTSFTLGFTIL